MIRRSVRMSLAAAMLATLILFPLPARSGTTTPGVRPDAWIKLCGSKVGCTGPRNPPTSQIPWRGNDIYNRTGFHQKAPALMDEGTWIFYWITFQNDGPQRAKYLVKGCVGKGRFMVQQYALGTWTRMRYLKSIIITEAVKSGRQVFTLDPGETRRVTLAIQAQ